MENILKFDPLSSFAKRRQGEGILLFDFKILETFGENTDILLFNGDYLELLKKILLMI